MVLNKKQEKLLYSVVNCTKCFDKRDNSFLLSNRKLADRLKVSASQVDQLFRVLGKHGLIKKVLNTHQVLCSKTGGGKVNTVKVRMLSPKFLWISMTKTDRFYYSKLFDLGCVVLADQWRKTCREVAGFVDIDTGEIADSFTWHKVDELAESYSCWDRCYRKGVTNETIKEDYNTSQQYCIKDSDKVPLTLQDVEWIKVINSESAYHYPRIAGNLRSNKPRVKNMYLVDIYHNRRFDDE